MILHGTFIAASGLLGVVALVKTAVEEAERLGGKNPTEQVS